MAKAQITTPDGIEVKLQGTPQEIAAVLKEAGARAKAEGLKARPHTLTRNKATIPNLVDELKHEGFFKSPKTLSDIRKKLADLGRNYPLTTLSGAMRDEVRKRTLRRFKEKKRYVYAQ